MLTIRTIKTKFNYVGLSVASLTTFRLTTFFFKELNSTLEQSRRFILFFRSFGVIQ